MFRIACVFDEESGVDALDPFGDVEIKDDYETITVRTTYLDSWLDALLKTVNQIQIGAKLIVAIPEEPEPLRVCVGTDGKITVQYQDLLVRADSRQAFEEALRHACQSFLGRVSELEEAPRNSVVASIRESCQRLAASAG